MLSARSLRGLSPKCSYLEHLRTSLRLPAAGSRFLKTRTACLGRVQSSSSRATSSMQASHASRRLLPLTQLSAARVPNDVLRGGTILQSAFPKKTFLALVLLGLGLYYWVDVEEVGWAEDALAAYTLDQLPARPLHFYENKEELTHFLDYHLPDFSITLKEPAFVQLIFEGFNQLAGGWMMTEEDANTEKLPITHGCRFRSNEPCEDFHALGTSPGPGEIPWNFWSIMDGHAGRSTSYLLQQELIPYLSLALVGLPVTSSSMEIENTMKQAFLRLDKKTMDFARTLANWYPAANATVVAALAPALSGSCALLAAFDPTSSTLRVACTGDSRAVLGRWDPTAQTYTCIPLSEDQTGFNVKEVERLAAAHPDEPDIIDPKTGRMFGIAVTRAFGDHRWKWDNDFIKQVQSKFWGTAPRPGAKTPPYMTAEPEVTETRIVRAEPNDRFAKSDFMIMASDGLWDRMSSEHAVACVERWLEAKARGKGFVSNDPQLLQNPPVVPADLTALEPGVTNQDGEVDWQATPEYFTIEDENAAVCLVKNAMGGTRRNLVLGILSACNPTARNAFDDTTIMVVFFDKLTEKKVAAAKSKGENQDGRPWWRPW